MTDENRPRGGVGDGLQRLEVAAMGVDRRRGGDDPGPVRPV